jgi:hypothetical protein
MSLNLIQDERFTIPVLQVPHGRRHDRTLLVGLHSFERALHRRGKRGDILVGQGKRLHLAVAPPPVD